MVLKKARKNVTSFVALGATVGIGSQVLGATGSTQGQAGLAKVSGILPATGTVIGGSMVLGSLTKLSDTVRPRRKTKRR